MGYYEVFSRYKDFRFGAFLSGLSERDVKKAVEKDKIDERRFLSLLSPQADGLLEEMARRSQEITSRHFGRTIQLYTPIYLSNFCDNECLYCGFNSRNPIARRRLTLDEVEREARFISSTGLRHILILTGESRKESPLSYTKDCVRILRRYFDSISIEIYPLTEIEYKDLIQEGVDGLTIYQEVYDELTYKKVHPAGPKKDYVFRLDAPERGARSGMRNVNIGALLGLSDWRREVFFMGLHAKYLQDNFPDVEIGASVPRIRPHTGAFKIASNVDDKDLAQIILALRLFLPRIGIALSTREDPQLRENLVGLGITRMSAGSTTVVGGHTIESCHGKETSQFEILDKRTVEEIKAMIERHGYQPVFKDWARF